MQCCNDTTAQEKRDEELKFITNNAIPLLSTEFVTSPPDVSGNPTTIQIWGKRSIMYDDAARDNGVNRAAGQPPGTNRVGRWLMSSSPSAPRQQMNGESSIPQAVGEEDTESFSQTSSQQTADIGGKTAVPVIITNLANVHVIQVVCGETHALLLSMTGAVYVLGVGDRGQLGLGLERLFVTEPELLDLTDPPNAVIVSIAAGSRHSVALCATGEVLCWGHVDCIGDGMGVDRAKPVRLASKVFRDQRVALIAAAHSQTMAITERNELFIWGDTFACHYYLTPQCHWAFGKSIKQVSIGRHFALALANDGTLYGWGDSTYCELGPLSGGATHSKGAHYPTVIPLVDSQGNAVSKVIGIAAGDRHSLLVTNEGQVYSFGDNLCGQLGIPTHIVRASTAQLVRLTAGTSKLAGSEVYAGARHSAVVTSQRKLMTWGHAGHHKLIHTAPAATLLEERYGVGERDVGVAVRSGLKDCVAKPKLVYSLLRDNVSCVALGEEFTIVVLGDRFSGGDRFSELKGEKFQLPSEKQLMSLHADRLKSEAAKLSEAVKTIKEENGTVEEMRQLKDQLVQVQSEAQKLRKDAKANQTTMSPPLTALFKETTPQLPSGRSMMPPTDDGSDVLGGSGSAGGERDNTLRPPSPSARFPLDDPS